MASQGKKVKLETAVIGLGRFGSSLACALMQHGCAVLGVDRDEELVQQHRDLLTHVVRINSTDDKALQDIDITAYDVVIVAIGTDFEANLMTTVALKNLGMKTIICKASTERQKQILEKIGASRVVLPESDAGELLAKDIASHVHELVLESGYRVTELPVPNSLVGRTLFSANLTQRCNVTVLAVNSPGRGMESPSTAYELQARDLLLVMGSRDDIERLLKLD